MSMLLTSTGFGAGAKIPMRFTCDGADISPQLAWTDPPSGTRSFAIICADPDAPTGIWYHWAVFDLPAGTRDLAENHPRDSISVRQAVNDFGKQRYGGPCPPHGNGSHHYRFTLYALDIERLDVPAGARCRDVEKAAKLHAIATATLTGLYQR
jgi:Raf kinase inhibitor-like YbhB/YbcL family protein